MLRAIDRVKVTTQHFSKPIALDKIHEIFVSKGIQATLLKPPGANALPSICAFETANVIKKAAPITHFVTEDGLHICWGGSKGDFEGLQKVLWKENKVIPVESLLHEVSVEVESKNETKTKGDLTLNREFTSFTQIAQDMMHDKVSQKTHNAWIKSGHLLAKLPLSLACMEVSMLSNISKKVDVIEKQLQSVEKTINGTINIQKVKTASATYHVLLQQLNHHSRVECEQKSFDIFSNASPKNVQQMFDAYKHSVQFLEIHAKRYILKKRIHTSLGALDLLRSECHTEKSHWLEWIIIWLILVEVILGLRNLTIELLKSYGLYK